MKKVKIKHKSLDFFDCNYFLIASCLRNSFIEIFCDLYSNLIVFYHVVSINGDFFKGVFARGFGVDDPF